MIYKMVKSMLLNEEGQDTVAGTVADGGALLRDVCCALVSVASRCDN